jgi:hypothetical protein
VTMVAGQPIFYPPTWIDPQRAGIRNTVQYRLRN